MNKLLSNTLKGSLKLAVVLGLCVVFGPLLIMLTEERIVDYHIFISLSFIGFGCIGAFVGIYRNRQYLPPSIVFIVGGSLFAYFRVIWIMHATIILTAITFAGSHHLKKRTAAKKGDDSG